MPVPGYKLEQQLVSLGVSTAGQLRGWSRADLVQQFGDRIGALLYLACRGKVGGQAGSTPPDAFPFDCASPHARFSIAEGKGCVVGTGSHRRPSHLLLPRPAPQLATLSTSR